MQNLSFTFVDLLVVLILIVSTAYAIYRGFVRETLSIFAWAAAAFATLYFGPAVARFLAERLSPVWLGELIGYGAVFLLVLIPLSFVSYRFSESVKHSEIGAIDRTLGLAFGVVRGLAIVGLAYLVFSVLIPPKTQPNWIQQARLLPLIQSSSEVMLSLVPEQDTQFANALKPAATHPTAKKPAKSAAKPAAKPKRKGYSAGEREGLNSLIQATGNGKHR